MMYIGLSLSRCLHSIAAGEVSEKQVLCIIARTMCSDYKSYMTTVDSYLKLSMMPDAQKEEVSEIAAKLYLTGRIHQPRLYQGIDDTSNPFTGTNAPVWLEIAPNSVNSSPAVIEAYKHYLLLDSLTK